MGYYTGIISCKNIPTLGVNWEKPNQSKIVLMLTIIFLGSMGINGLEVEAHNWCGSCKKPTIDAGVSF